MTDVTELNVDGQKLYLSPIMDLYNGEILAFELRALKLGKDCHHLAHGDSCGCIVAGVGLAFLQGLMQHGPTSIRPTMPDDQ